MLRQGKAAEKNRRPARALHAYRQAVRLAPADQSVLITLGRVQVRIGDYSGALATAIRLETNGHDDDAEQLRKQLR